MDKKALCPKCGGYVRPGVRLPRMKARIYELIHQGCETHAILDRLGITPATLRSHVKQMNLLFERAELSIRVKGLYRDHYEIMDEPELPLKKRSET